METVHPNSFRLVTPDTGYRLPPEERAKVYPYFDADALERLLAAVSPEVRQVMLEGFQIPKPGEVGPQEWVVPTTHIGDPELQPLVEEVWATVWERRPDLLDNDAFDYPGKEIARRRREARRQQQKPE